MASLSITSIFALLAIISTASAAKLIAVNAGINGGDIGELTKANSATGILEICPEDHPNGFSVRCEDNVNPLVVFYKIKAGVAERIQSEGNAPYHIAGDRDATGEVFVWDDWMTVPTRNDGSRKFTVRCQFRNNNGAHKKINRPIIIKGAGCGTPPPVNCDFTSTTCPDPNCVVQDADCPCVANTKNCPNFLTKELAQKCFDKCFAVTSSDLHGLDRDSDGLACVNNNACA